MKKMFLSVDDTYPLFHQMQKVGQELTLIAEEGGFGTIYRSEHFEKFDTEDYAEYDLAVFYTDHWIDKSPTVHQQVQALLSYILSGGSMLLIHNMDPGSDSEIAQIMGARLKHPLKKPGKCIQTFQPAENGHPILEGVAVFTIEEELFGIEYSMNTVRIPLLFAETPGGLEMLPAGWLVEYGKGKVICLLPGHDAETFCNPQYRRIILNSMIWLAGQGHEKEEQE